MALYPVHELSPAELAILRTRIPEQSTDIRLAIWPRIPEAVIWEARVNVPLPASDDMVYEITYDGGGANFADTIADMTVWIGSAARSYDRGIVRLRVAAGAIAGTLEIGETSEVVWTDDDYITVIDDFGLWPRHVYLSPAGVIFMDRDVAYVDQNLYPDPIPILLSDVVLEYAGVLGGANTVDALFDGSDSWALDGGVITYAWAAPGASAGAGLATATPTITYDAAGTFRVSCTITRNYGGGNIKTFTAYRYVHVFDDDNLPVISFYLDSCSGNWSSGGWSFSVTMEDNARRSEIVDRAKVILFANDNVAAVGPIYSDTHGLLRANILAMGWIAGETIQFNNEKGTVEFDVQGPKFWFEKMPAFPQGLEDFDGNPTTWLEFDDLDIRSGDWSWLRWRTTAPRSMDCYVPLADVRQIRQFSMPGSSSLWDQLKRINEQSILASPACDRYGRLWIRRPLSLMFAAERVGTPTVMDITRPDWREQIDIERVIVDELATLDASGIGYLNATADPYYMLVLGHIYKRYGGVDSMEKLALFQNQNTNNLLAGLLYDYVNNEYPNVDVRMAGYYRVMDIVPVQRMIMSIAEADTERGIEWTDKALVPMSVMFTHDANEGVLEVDVSLEAETFGVEGITGDPPPTIPVVPVDPPTPPLPPIEPPPPPTSLGVVVMCQDQLAISFNFFDGVPDWYDLGDGGAVLAGVFQNIAARNNEAWLTTRDDLDMANTGLFHCSDILAAASGVPVWTLIKSAMDAAGDTGYTTINPNKCHIGSMWMRDDDDICAMIHSASNTAPPAGFTGVYVGAGGVVAYTAFPNAGGSPIFQFQTFGGTQHCVWGGAGDFFVAGKSNAAGWRGVVQTVGGATIDFSPPAVFNLTMAHNGYVRTWGIINVPPNSSLFGGGAWNPASSQSLVIQMGAGMGIITDAATGVTPYLYNANDGLYDLYIAGAVMIGDASVEFGVGELGGYAEFVPLDTQQIVWLVGSVADFATKSIILYTADQGTIWNDKGGAGATSLQTALGGVLNWSGWTGAPDANSICRIFAF